MKLTTLLTTATCLLAFAVAEPRRGGRGGRRGGWKTKGFRKWSKGGSHSWGGGGGSGSSSGINFWPEDKDGDGDPDFAFSSPPVAPKPEVEPIKITIPETVPEPEPEEVDTTPAPAPAPEGDMSNQSVCGENTARGTMWASGANMYTCAPLGDDAGDYCISTLTDELLGAADLCIKHDECGENGYCILVQGARRVCWQKTRGCDDLASAGGELK